MVKVMNDVLTRKIKTLAKQAWMESSEYHKSAKAPLQIIEMAIYEAVLAERKRCADIAFDHLHTVYSFEEAETLKNAIMEPKQ